MNKDITPININGQRHGYWETYWNGEVFYKCFFVNDKEVGYEESYYLESIDISIVFHL